LEEEAAGNGGSKERYLSAELDVPVGAPFPPLYLEMDPDYIQSSLTFDTEITVEQKRNMRVYQFKRVYEARRYLRMNFGAMFGVDEDLEERVMEKGIFEVSESDRNEYTSELMEAFIYVQYTVFEEASGYLVLWDGLPVSFKRSADEQARDFLAKRVNQDLVLDILSAPDDSIPVMYERLINTVTNELIAMLQKIVAQSGFGTVEHAEMAYRRVVSENKVTERLSSYSFSVEVHMPGTIVSTNGVITDPGSNVVEWQFDGEQLHDSDVSLSVTSVLEEKR